MKTLTTLISLLLIACLSSCIYVNDEEHEGFGDWDDDFCGPACLLCDDDECVKLKPGASECASDAECSGTDVCIGGECIYCPQTCSNNDNCSKNYLCSDDGVCIPDDRCRNNNDCKDTEICSQNGYCVKPKTQTKDPKDCQDDDCVTLACRDNTECRVGSTCTNGACVADCG